MDIIPKASNDEIYKYQSLAQTIFKAMEDGDLPTINNFILALRKNNHFSALILAEVLTKLHDNWAHISRRAGIQDDFVSYAEGEFLVSPQTVNKYTSMWRAVFDNPNIPANVKDALKYKPINFLLRLTALAMESPSNEIWEQVLACETVGELRQLIRELRGEATSSKTAITFHYRIREGTIIGKQGDESIILAVVSKNPTNKELLIKLLAVLLERAGVIVD